MHITPAQFNLIVAAYAIAAGIPAWWRGFSWTALSQVQACCGLFLVSLPARCFVRAGPDL